MVAKTNNILSPSAVENQNGIGKNFSEMQGFIEEHKPEIPYIQIEFYSKASVALLFSETKTEGKNKRRFIHGADWFNSKMYNILKAIKEDDPFADQILLNIEESFSALGKEYQEQQQYLKNEMEKRLSASNASVIFNKHMHCVTINITYENRISYDLLWTLKELDNIFYYLYLNEKYSIMDTAEIREIRNNVRSKFRKTLTQINDWTSTSITREDIAHNTKRVPIAWAKNAKINLTKEVLFLEQRAKAAPQIPTRKNNTLDEITLQKLQNLFATA